MPDVTVKGSGKTIKLDRRSYVAGGGEGDVYAKGGIAYKVCHDTSKMIPLGKIDELSVLDHPDIMRPRDVLLDAKNQPIGYTSPFIKDAYALCQLFTKAFKSRENVTHDMIWDLVKAMEGMVAFIHGHKILIVDLNELNFLVTHDFKRVVAIDVPSYQTPHYPATAIMDSIRDRHVQNNKFSAGTDWFSFGVVTFQLFIGIHPFKGKHPTLNMDQRMQRHISVFNADVRVPKACSPFDIIPDEYRDWYTRIFDRGERCAPPTITGPITIVVVPKISTVTGTDNFEITEVGEYNGDITYHYAMLGTSATLTTDHFYLNKIKVRAASPEMRLAVTPKQNRPILVFNNGTELGLYDMQRRVDVQSDIACQRFMTYDGRVYIKSGESLNEIVFVETANSVMANSKRVANILEHATQLFDGVIIQNLLGSCFVSVFPKAGHHYQVNIKELNNHKILDAKFDGGVLVIAAEANGKYDTFIVRFADDYQAYDVRAKEDITYAGVNFVTLDNGVCALINEEEQLELFSRKKGSTGVKIADDDAIKGDMKLFKDGAKVLFVEANKLYHLAMK